MGEAGWWSLLKIWTWWVVDWYVVFYLGIILSCLVICEGESRSMVMSLEVDMMSSWLTVNYFTCGTSLMMLSSCLVLSCHVMSCHVLSCLVSCLFLSCDGERWLMVMTVDAGMMNSWFDQGADTLYRWPIHILICYSSLCVVLVRYIVFYWSIPLDI